MARGWRYMTNCMRNADVSRLRPFAAPASLGLAFWLVLALVAALYGPALAGPFLFDDKPHLSALKARGGIDNFDSLLAYIRSGYSGPTGRPVSLLSFLLDANDWPAKARSFKYTNLCIHLLNGSLLFLVCLQLLRLGSGAQKHSNTAVAVALFSTCIWLAHPYLVSTTMYVIQRMAMLSTLFVFVALAIWLKARPSVGANTKAAYAWMTFAMVVPGSLALLSKENGALLPLLILAIEVTIIRYAALDPLKRAWKIVFLYIPSAAIVGYLIYYPSIHGWFNEYPDRDFSAFERLLTEMRVLADYLRHWFLPDLYTTGIFQDHVEVSQGFFNPPRTLIALVFLTGLSTFAWKARTKLPLLSLAILFFLASQLIESTTIALDLKFEHRMYLGSSFLFLPVFYNLLLNLDARLMVLPALIIVIVFATIGWKNAALWGDYDSMVEVWADRAPDSPRAQIEAVNVLYSKGRTEAALDSINSAAARMPDNFYVRLNQVLVQCKASQATERSKEHLLGLARSTDYAPIWFAGMKSLMRRAGSAGCQGVDNRYFGEIVESLLLHPPNRDPHTLGYSHLAYMKGVAMLRLDRYHEAFRAFEAALSARETPGQLMKTAARLATVGCYDQALEYALQAKALVSGEHLQGRALVEAPSGSDIEEFIETVKQDRDQNGTGKHCHSSEKRGGLPGKPVAESE